MSLVRVITGPDRWLLQTEQDVHFIDIWAVEAIAKVVRHVDSLGRDLDMVSETSMVPHQKDNKKEHHDNR